MRQGLVEWAVVTAFLALVAAGASLRYRAEIRSVFLGGGTLVPVRGTRAPPGPPLAPP